jgi:allantoin racemase
MKKEEGTYSILVVNPILRSDFDEADREFFAKNANPSFKIKVESLKQGPASIESHYDELLAAPFVVKKVIEAEQRGFDAVVINCFLNPGMYASREVVDIPVVGPGEAAIHLALLVGNGFSIIDPGPRRYVSYAPTEQVRRMGVSSRFVSVRGAGVAVLEITKNMNRTTEMIGKQAEMAVREDGADVVVLGCTGLAGLAPKIQKVADVPVIDPALAALKVAEALCQLGLPPNRMAYPKPPEKVRKLPSAMRVNFR